MIDYIKKTTGNKSHFETYHTGRKTSKGIQLNYKQKITEAVQQLQSYGEVGKELAKVLLSKQEFTEEYLKSLGKEEKLGKELLKQFIMTSGYREDYDLFLEYFNKFEYYDEVVLDMIKYSDCDFVTEQIKENWNKFKIENYEEVLIEACDRWQDLGFVEFVLEKGKGFTERTIDKLIEHHRGDLIVKYFDKFEGVGHQVIVNKLIEGREGKIVCEYLEKFQGLNHQEVVNKLIETKQGNVVGIYLEKFQGLNHQEVVNKLIETRQGDVVWRFLKKFQGVNHKSIVNKLIENEQGNFVLDHKELFQLTEEERVEPMNRLSKCLKLGDILYNIGKFPGVMHQGIINRVDVNNDYLIERLHWSIGCVACQLSVELAEKLCNRGWVRLVAETRTKFDSFNVKIAKMFIKAGYHDIVLENPEKFGLKKKMNS